jgi:hypothetical protein
MQVYRAKEFVRNSNTDLAKKEKNDCTVYALASCCDADYEEAYEMATTLFNRPSKKGPAVGEVIAALRGLKQSGDDVLGCKVTDVISYPKTQTKWKLGGEKRMRRMRIKTFLKEYPEGTYYILVRGHALTIKDGSLVDSAPGKFPEKRIVDYAFKIERKK